MNPIDNICKCQKYSVLKKYKVSSVQKNIRVRYIKAINYDVVSEIFDDEHILVDMFWELRAEIMCGIVTWQGFIKNRDRVNKSSVLRSLHDFA